MKILLYVTDVVDTNLTVALEDGHPAIEGLKRALNPFDEIAAETAVALKEKGAASEVVAIAIGPAATKDALFRALAIGADRGIYVATDAPCSALDRSRILSRIVTDNGFDAVMTGKLDTDSDTGFMPVMLAFELGWVQVTNARELSFEGDSFVALSNAESGTVRSTFKAPFVLTADLRLSTPRYVTLPMMMRARKKTIDTIEAQTFELSKEVSVQTVAWNYPKNAKETTVVGDAQALLTALKGKSERF